MKYILFNKKTKQIYCEICPYDKKPDVVYFDSISIANNNKPSKKWSIIDLNKARYPSLFSKFTGMKAIFDFASFKKPIHYFSRNFYSDYKKYVA